MDEDALRRRIAAWRARAAAARDAPEREACAELARQYEALLALLAASPGARVGQEGG
jgi:hypothetical protein